MKKNRSKSINLSTLLSIVTALLISTISFFACIILYYDYKFNEATLKRSESILSNGLLKGAMPLAVAANDIDQIKSIVHDQLAFEEIYAVAIHSENGELLYRKEKNIAVKVNILPKKFDLLSPYNNLEIDAFEHDKNDSQKKLGSVIIYFSTERLYDSAKEQLYFTLAVIVTAIISCFALIFAFNRYVSHRLRRITQLMQAIKNGQNFPAPEKCLTVNELEVIDLSLRDMANTIYERDKELKNSLNNALEAKIQAQKAEEFKDDFIRAISHDLKTPIGVVLNLLELINDEIWLRKLDPTLAQQISACYRSAKLLSDIAGELFNLEQFQRRELVNRINCTNINDLFSNIASLYEQKFSEKGLLFKVQNTRPENYASKNHILMDESKLILLLENIIDNALKFTENGWVCVSWELYDTSLQVSVRDSGIGIPEDKIASIFEKHRQLGDLETVRHEGRGLGLYYVKRLVDVMAAKLVVSSKVGIGSVFDINIPYEKIQHQPVIDLQSQSLSALIIDDDEMTCFTLTKMLEKIGLVSHYECIPEIGYARLVKDAPDIVFIDYHMPNTSGDEIALRAQQILYPHASFYVCITAESNLEKLKILAEIFHAVLQKPFASEELAKIVEFAKTSKHITANYFSNMDEG